jgi:hypothetical protein
VGEISEFNLLINSSHSILAVKLKIKKSDLKKSQSLQLKKKQAIQKAKSAAKKRGAPS